MRSWVRYSVSAYLGLLLAGSIASPGLRVPQLGEPMASVYPTSAPAPVRPIRLYHQPTIDTQDQPTRADS